MKYLMFNQSQYMSCPYIAGREEKLLYTVIDDQTNFDDFNNLNNAGFRRTRDIFYHPICHPCHACTSLRIKANSYKFSKRERRILNKNASITMQPIISDHVTQEHYQLFISYITKRHHTSDMVYMSLSDFKSMFIAQYKLSLMYEYKEQGKLVAIIIVDRFDDGFSAVYSAYDIGLSKRSLGIYMVLSLIQEAQLYGLEYIYLGYWIKNSDNMDYKKKFQHLEYFEKGFWLPMDNLNT